MEQPRQHVSVKPATCLLANDDGTFKVLPDSGRGSSAPIDGVRPLLDGADIAIGDRLVLIWQRPGEPIPWILTTGDSTPFGTFQGWRDLGFWGMIAD